MNVLRLIVALAALVLFSAVLRAQSISGIEPANAKKGDTVSATGEGIDKSAVPVFYLTDGKTDFKCDVVEQNAKLIKFKVPADVKPGRWSLMIETKTGQLLQLPVKLTVE